MVKIFCLVMSLIRPESKLCISGKSLAVELPHLIMPFQTNTLHSSLYTFFSAKCMDVLYNIPSALTIQGLLSH